MNSKDLRRKNMDDAEASYSRMVELKKRINKKPPASTEHAEQAALFRWAEFEAKFNKPMLKLLFAVPNGSYKNPIQATKYKREGLKAGVPDIMLPYPKGGYCGLFIELKRREKSHVTDEQKWWLQSLTLVGCQTMVCKGWEEAKDAILVYLDLPINMQGILQRKAVLDFDDLG